MLFSPLSAEKKFICDYLLQFSAICPYHVLSILDPLSYRSTLTRCSHINPSLKRPLWEKAMKKKETRRELDEHFGEEGGGESDICKSSSTA